MEDEIMMEVDKMTNEDKVKLIKFYKCNPCLWDSTYQGKKKAKAKEKDLLFEQLQRRLHGKTF